tara:strand:+ start:1677 stop:2129 length:453 start_codon:yes stop_codon:yes gene_type:complete
MHGIVAAPVFEDPDPVNFSVPGTVLKFALPPPATQLRRTHFWNVKGESEIRGNSGGRTFRIPMWLHPFTSHREASDFIQDKLNGEFFQWHGTLTLGDGVNVAPLKHVTFEGAVLMGNPGIIPDHAGFLGGGWIANVGLQFRQNLIGEEEE